MTIISLPEAIRAHLRRRGPVAAEVSAVADTAFDLLGAGLLNLPLPGQGQTLIRWQAMAEVAAHDLAVARLVEGHLDAQATLAEAGVGMTDGLWGAWVASSPNTRLTATFREGEWELSGTKRWCSGARSVTSAIVTAKDAGSDRLFVLPVRQVGARFDPNSWPAVGMALADTLTMTAERLVLPAEAQIGPADWYTQRSGHWAATIAAAAVWYGGSLGLTRALRAATAEHEADPFALVHLGKLDALCMGMDAALAAAAKAVDIGGRDEARTASWQARGVISELAATLLQRAAAALGSEPLCHDPVLARRVADLTVSLQQHGAEREYAALGADVLDSGRRQ